jgi:hypothetical protein
MSLPGGKGMGELKEADNNWTVRGGQCTIGGFTGTG